MTESAKRQIPRWLTAILFFVFTLILTTLTYLIPIVGELYYYILILVVLLLWIYVDKQQPENLGFRFFRTWWLQLLLGILLAGLIVGLVVWLEVLLGWVNLTPEYLGQPLGLLAGALTVYALNTAIVVIGEEMGSRGYIQQNLATRIIVPFAILITAVMFAMFHIPGILLHYVLPPVPAIIMFSNLFIAGIWLGLAFTRTRNLWLPIGLHLGWNFVLYYIIGIRGQGLFQYQSVGPEILTGGIVGPEAGLIGTAAFLFLLAITWIGTSDAKRQLLRMFEAKALVMFAVGFLVILIPVVLGLLVAGLWIFLVIWVVYAIFFLQVWENKILCSHCPHYGSEGRTLRCHANYGLYKLWKYNPAPMSRSEQAQIMIGVVIMIGFPFPFLVWAQQWLFLVFALFGAIVLGVILFGWLCLRCVNFSCPFNRVPKEEVDAFLKEHSEMRKAWEEKGYKVG
ncbi:MAG: lysostaphin resistance A-like protein [Promethearchaeota archaeon]